MPLEFPAEKCCGWCWFRTSGGQNTKSRTQVGRCRLVQWSTCYNSCRSSFHNDQAEDIVQPPLPWRWRWDGGCCVYSDPWVMKLWWQCPPITGGWAIEQCMTPRLALVPMLTTSYRSEDFTILCKPPHSRRLGEISKRYTNTQRWMSRSEMVQSTGYSTMITTSLKRLTWRQVSYVHW